MDINIYFLRRTIKKITKYFDKIVELAITIYNYYYLYGGKTVHSWSWC